MLFTCYIVCLFNDILYHLQFHLYSRRLNVSDKLNNLVSLEVRTIGNELVCEVEMRDIDNDEKHCSLFEQCINTTQTNFTFFSCQGDNSSCAIVLSI